MTEEEKPEPTLDEELVHAVKHDQVDHVRRLLLLSCLADSASTALHEAAYAGKDVLVSLEKAHSTARFQDVDTMPT